MKAEFRFCSDLRSPVRYLILILLFLMSCTRSFESDPAFNTAKVGLDNFMMDQVKSIAYKQHVDFQTKSIDIGLDHETFRDETTTEFERIYYVNMLGGQLKYDIFPVEVKLRMDVTMRGRLSKKGDRWESSIVGTKVFDNWPLRR